MSEYPRLLDTFSGEGFVTKAFEETPGGRCYVLADADVDVDGSGSSHGDPYYQNDTSLHNNGKPLNADEDRFIVLPPQLMQRVKGVVLGCRARVTYRGVSVNAVVGDIGPRKKIGELSYSLAKDLAINPSPINGGVDGASVLYEWWPGEAAPGYKLQPL